jgi:type II secretory pathway pseudopilin PulG
VRQTQTVQNGGAGEGGFSLIELVVAMGVTLVVLTMASSLLSASFNVRTREDRRTAALADAQRALNTVTREITNSGYNLKSNGILASQSDDDSLTVLSDYNMNNAWDVDEVVSFKLADNPNTGTKSLVRYALDAAGAASTTGTVLAENVDSFKVRYFASKRDYTTGVCDIDDASAAAATTPDKAQYVVLVVCATLPAAGREKSPGYQPASRVQLVSDATLRNSLMLTNSTLPKY